MARAAQNSLTHPPEVNLARRVLVRFELTAPVDVITLARNYAEVSIERLPIDADGVCYDLKKSGVRPKIVLNKLRPPTRLRFTAAHELGHVLIPWHTGIMVDDTSTQSPGLIPHYQMEEEANRFASELLLPSDWLSSEVKRWGNPIELVAHAASLAIVSPAATVMKLVTLLDPGHLYAQVDKDGIIVVSGRSPGTVASGLHWGMPVDAEAQFTVCEERWMGQIGGANYCWWKLPSRSAVPAPQGTAVPAPRDSREWRAILNEILLDVADDGLARQHAKQSINGVIGAMNGRSSSQSIEQLYAALLQRFEVRRQENVLYERVFLHPKFADFLSQRVIALKS
ncbi:ImmA/IrrE family metallo-endopeptidase [Rhodopila sp.]|uniref:ImmA/IrrE family metallo-endopeptidase n=1 Tax=Rhodopila sp. TaxID=2480087 RepID=UPI003D12E7D3